MLSCLGLLCLLIVCGFAPGFFFVRKLRWSPMEKLCGSVGLSFIFIYLAAWGIYLLRPPGGPAAYFAVSAISLVLGALAWKDMRALAGVPQVRRTLRCFGFLLAWTLLILSMIRVYSGAGWGGDWIEHFQRSLFFLDHFPANTPIYGNYQVPARPPMMNVIASFFMAQTNDQYYNLQVAFTFLNLLMFLPCCLILPALAQRRLRGMRASGRLWILTALFAMSPVVIEACTYGWTKAFTGFYVALAFCFYLSGWRKDDRLRTTLAFVFLAAGLLAHYSAGPYIALLALHYLVFAFRKRPGKWLELAGIAVACGLLLATWFGWSMATYGVNATFKSNTSVTSVGQYQGSNWVKIGANLFDTFVPQILRDPGSAQTFAQPNRAGWVRDVVFLMYQMNFVAGMGLVGGPLALWLFYRMARRKGVQTSAGAAKPPRRNERWFWLIAVPFCYVVGIAVVGERSAAGSANLTLIAIQILAFAWIAASFPLRRLAAVALVAGCAADFCLGVFLQARIESLENTRDHTVFTLALSDNGQPGPGPDTPDTLYLGASSNWFSKHQYEISATWAQQLASQQPADAATQRVRDNALRYAAWTLRQDVDYWHGWMKRHDYRIIFFGDLAAEWVGESLDASAGLLALAFFGLMAVFAREAIKPQREARSRNSAKTGPERRARSAKKLS